MGDNHIAIPALLKIGPGALGELGTYLKDLRSWKKQSKRHQCLHENDS